MFLIVSHFRRYGLSDVHEIFQACACVFDLASVRRVRMNQVLTSDAVFSAPMADTYRTLGVDPKDTTTLEAYLQEYYTQILKKLKDVKAQSKQGDFYI